MTLRRIIFLAVALAACDSLDPIILVEGGPLADAYQDSASDGDGGGDGGPDAVTNTCDGGTIGLSGILPAFGWFQSMIPVTINGQGFFETPTAELIPNAVPDGGVTRSLASIGFVAPSSITASVPAGIAPGLYDLRVINPNGCAVTLPKAYTAVGNPPPVIVSVAPATGTFVKDTPVVVTGCHFPNNATLSTISATSQIVTHSVQTVSCSGGNVPECDDTPPCTMSATIQTFTKMLQPGPYVVRVTNPNEATWGDWSAFVVTDPSGKLTGMWAQAPSLVIGRRSLQATAGSIDSARRFLYAVGGEDSNGAAQGTVEVCPVDAFGKLGKWFVQKPKLAVPRSGLALVRQGRYLWALGGTSSTGGTAGLMPSGTGLGSIERAKILDPADAPKVANPSVSLAGTLAKGTWYYRVSAVLTNADPDNPSGETLASDEKIAVLGAQGSVSETWPGVSNAAYYRVYRSPMANGTSGSEVLLKDNLGATTFVDDGSLSPGSEQPVRLGSTGTWRTMGTLAAATFNASAVVLPESSLANAPLHVYVLGGWGKCTNMTGAMSCYQYASLSANGDTLGAFTLDTTHAMQKARMRFGSTPVTSANGPAQFADAGGPNTAAFLLAGGGAGISAISNTVEYALVGNGGVLGNWATATGFAQQRDGSQLLMISGYAYSFQGGIMGNYSSSTDLSTNAQVSPSSFSFGNWSNAGAQLPYLVGRHGLALESAYFYVIGGTKDDKDALTEVYQIIY